MVGGEPVSSIDRDGLRRYVAAFDNATTPASFEWRGANRAIIRTRALPEQLLYVQVTFDPGWRAKANGHPCQIRKDGTGQMALRPACNGDCEITLEYTGGVEMKLCWAASVLTLLGVAALASKRLRGART